MKREQAFIGGSIVAAIAASLCCILPIVFALAGAGIAGASAFFEAWRPELLAVTMALLGLGFYFAYRKPKQACAPGSACERPTVNRAGRLWLWISAALIVLFAAFPHYSGPVAEFVLSDGGSQPQSASADSGPQFTKVTFVVEGLCPSCAKSVEDKLKQLKGIHSVAVSDENGQTDVEFDSTSVSEQEIGKAIEAAGYRIHKN
ncbi:MAG TPA: mercuric transporter MerT family protein [Candidatus Saccharimonadales bacterium]|jgi:mercuric ion transport protein|nr:mercuric transporter MerT family protein [Candidatus Saccharimonadales bacterium]